MAARPYRPAGLLALAAAVLCVLAAPRVGAQNAGEPRRPNVLFIAVDDLRPELGCYGKAHVKSPNIDRLARRGLLFNRAYCQQAVCSPSRSSLMTGRRPDTTKVWDLNTHFRAALPDVVTLPQHFRAHGYHTQAFGKIYHGGYDDAPSWSVPSTGPRAPGYGPEGQALLQQRRREARGAGQDVSRVRGLPWEAPDVADEALNDGSLATQAIAALREIKDRSFFLAVGFLKPHLPFVAPKKYWDLYRPEEIRLAANPNPPQDAPGYALHDSGELRAYHGIPARGPLPEEQARKMVHGYLAATSFMDAQVGRLLDALEETGQAQNTVIVLWGDHGWQLGEHGMWCKHSNYETSTHVPLIVAAPGRRAVGQKTEALVEFVDIYPSLAQLCGLPAPEGVEGTSFAPLLADPARPWKKAVFSQYPRNVAMMGRGMGYSLRTDRWRLVEWSPQSNPAFREYELYDHRSDPGENVNLAQRPEHAETVRALAAQLREGWRGALPPP